MIERYGCEHSKKIHKEIAPDEIRTFIGSYIDEISTPLTLLNHVGPVTFESDILSLGKRQEALHDYFSRSASRDERVWGRCILSEIVSTKILNTIYEENLDENDMQFDLVPTEFDKSSGPFDDYYQKGADICLSRRIIHNNKKYLLPICGIDVTVGASDIVKKKRQKPGLQTKAAIPIIVLPLKNLFYQDRKLNFNNYLDNQAKESVKSFGEYQPLYGLMGKDIKYWTRCISKDIVNAACQCRKKISEEDPRIKDFPYLSHIDYQLRFMEKFARKAGRLLH